MKTLFINAVDYGRNYASGLQDVRYEISLDAPRAGARTLRSQEVVSIRVYLGLKTRIDLGLPLSWQDCTPEIWAQSADFRAELQNWEGKLAREFIPSAEIFSEYNSLADMARLGDQWCYGDSNRELYEDNGEAYVLTADGQAMRDEARARRAEILAQIDASCVLYSAAEEEEEKEEKEEETVVINLTQHAATADQLAAGVVDFTSEIKAQVQMLLTFDMLPCAETIRERAATLAAIASECGFESAMIGGAPFLMAPLEAALKSRGIKPLYAFSVRDSVEKQNPDGSVTKQNIFKHGGFIEI